jgi:hypothetical protein
MRLLKGREYGIEIYSWRYLGLELKSFWTEFKGLKVSLRISEAGEAGLRLRVIMIYDRVNRN